MEQELSAPNSLTNSSHLIVWLVGNSNETQDTWNYIEQRMEKDKNPQNQSEMSGSLHLRKKNVFQVKFSTMDAKYFQEMKKGNLEADGVIICDKGLSISNKKNRRLFQNFLEWGNLKAMCFVDPSMYSGNYHAFYTKFGNEEMKEDKLRDFMKKLTKPKKKNFLRLKGTRYFKMSQEGTNQIQGNTNQIKEETKMEIELQTQTDRQTLKKHLARFLSYKYHLDNHALEKQLENEKWKKRFTNWELIRDILKEKDPVEECANVPEKRNQGITVILPKEGNPELNFEFLKAAAYFPYQLDPIPFKEYSSDEDILTQLSFAAHYGYWNGRYELSRLDLRYKSLTGHIICDGEVPFNNSEDTYYEFPRPKLFRWKSNKGKNTIPFDPDVDKKRLNKFSDYLVKIIQTGKRPDIDYTDPKYIERNKLEKH